MDSSMWTSCGSTNGCEFDHEFDSNNSDTNDVWDLPLMSNIPDSIIHSGYLSQRSDRGSAKENDFSDAILSYINQVLMEDDLEDEVCMIQHSTIHAAEQSLYEILSKKDQSSSTQWQPHEGAKSSSDDSITHCRSNCSSCSNSSLELVITSELNKSKSCHVHDAYVDQTMLTNSESFCLPTCSCHTAAGIVGSLVNAPSKGVEEKGECKMLKDVGHLRKNLMRRNSLHREESDYLEEERKKKHLVVYDEEYILSEMFDKVLSLYGKNDRCASRTRNIVALQNGESKQNEPAKSFFGERICTTKGVRKRKAIDLRSLLIQCMQSVARNDHRSANKQLGMIRLRSSPLGDGSQRLAHYFANSLEARLLGRQKYKSLTSVMSDVDVLKAYELHLFVLPFMEIFSFFAGQVIMKLAKKAATIHIIQFGIVHGIEWLPLIQRLSTRPGGPPKLRITAINLPHHGIRPAAKVKETGSRFVKYCEMFNIPFEYKGISQQWETVSIKDLGIEKDEMLVVNCLYQFMYLLDDTIMEQSPRDAVLKLIRRICPDVFIHAITNGTYNSPFFVTRFREALFHYSALFDMFEATLPPENQERMVFERDILGNQFLNVIACEGLERVMRPETYKQWQTRTLRAGFRQLPISPDIMKELKAKVKSCYHKDFFVDEASQWLLSGWKGRVLVAFSCWIPA